MIVISCLGVHIVTTSIAKNGEGVFTLQVCGIFFCFVCQVYKCHIFLAGLRHFLVGKLVVCYHLHCTSSADVEVDIGKYVLVTEHA